MSSRRLTAGLLVAVILFVGGVAYVSLQVHADASASTTVGRITSANVTTYTQLGRPWVYGNTFYHANVTYTYVAHGSRYTSHSIFPGHYSAHVGRKPIADVATNYRRGETVTVYYPPSNPRQSYLVARYGFMPGFLAMVLAPFVAAYVLTPGFRWGTLVYLLVRQSLSGSNRSPTRGENQSSEWTTGNEWNDPASLTTQHGHADQSADESFVLRGRKEWGAWIGATLVTLGVVALYVTLSPPPYTEIAYVVALLAIVVTAARAGIRYQFS